MRRRPQSVAVEVDEVFLDATNLPAFNQSRLEGKRELPLHRRSIWRVAVVFIAISGYFLYEIFMLQITEGAHYRHIAENNKLDQAPVIAERGVVYDRRGEMLVWNEVDPGDEYDFPVRAYTDRPGLGQVLGYVSYPRKDARGIYFRTDYLGRSGVEAAYDAQLRGKNGTKIVEVDALNEVVSEFVLETPTGGGALNLSIDAELSAAMYDIIATSSAQAGFRSGAGAIMNVHTGEIIALTSFPSFDPEVMADGDDIELIAAYNEDDRLPFLNKMVGGAYTPGSVVKPFVAYAALNEQIIDPQKVIVSTGEIIVPNRFNPSNPARFTDWRAHGRMTMREAIAFSSNVYFYIIGGGFGDQPGLGITKLASYYRLFGLDTPTGILIAEERVGVIPDPAWKQAVFEDDWRLGDTYFTSIGQFGFLVTPIAMLRAYAALANGGYLVEPHVEAGRVGTKQDLELNQSALTVVREGMRMTVNYPGGTARGLERSDVAVAAKSGTAEVGAGNAYVNSWAAGYWPYEDPQYAFVLMMDRAPRSNALGATNIMGQVVAWMADNRPEYLGIVAAPENEE
jgi:penicillin-binding protein 2